MVAKVSMMTTGRNASCVSGFVKRLRDNSQQKVVKFVVARQVFMLPEISTFTMAVRIAHMQKWNVLILFEEIGKSHPRITGVIVQPLWSQRQAAAEGQSYDQVKALCPEGRALN